MEGFIPFLQSHFIGLDHIIDILQSSLFLWNNSSSFTSSMTSSTCGHLIRGPEGCGKTTLLLQIMNYFNSSHSISQSTSSSFSSSSDIQATYLDCHIFHSFPLCGQSEKYFLSILHKITLNSQKHLLLLDNLDQIFPSTNHSASSISLSLISILLNFIDEIKIKSYSTVWILATCSTTCITIPSKLLCSYRFGQPLEIPLPDMQTRYDIARRCLFEGISTREWCEKCTESDYELGISHLAAAISRGSKGFSVVTLSSRIFSSLDILQKYETFSLIQLTDQLCSKILANSLSILSVDFNLQNYFCDFSLSSISSPPQSVFGYEHIVDDIIMKCLPWKFLQKFPHLKCHFRPCRGVLLYGPTGCGKTAIATRIGYETKNEFKFLSVSCAELIHKVVGESEKRLSKLFNAARSMAPCFLLLDNIEVVLGISPNQNQSSTRTRRRSGHRTSHQAIDRILSTLLMEMDGIRTSNSSNEVEETVVVIATSLCHPSELDSALIRPGRLEEHIHILPPNELQVEKILRGIQGNTLSLLSEDQIAERSRLMTGKSVAEIVAYTQEIQYQEIRKKMNSLSS